MKSIKSSLFTTIIASTILACTCAFAETHSALIVSGQNNHNWKTSHKALELILSQSGMFKVDIALTPAAGEDMSGFKPEFNKYEVVVLDYNGDDWCEDTRNAFVEYVRNGGGLVIYHAANNAFAGWDEFNKIIALGGWGGRNGGNHGKQREYQMHCRDYNHPVTRGLPDNWMHARDELYDRMVGPSNIKDLLYSAKSDESTGGSGLEEPEIFTVDYGDSRIFHIMSGHCGKDLEHNPAMQCAGFQTLLLRGAEWAATGKVTQGVPADFPTENKVSLRPDYKAPRKHKGKPFIFVQMADTQIGFKDKSTDLVESDSLMKSAVDAINLINPECVIVTGDLLNDRYDERQRAIFDKRMNEINPRIPVYVTPGNHDIPEFNQGSLEEYLSHVGYDRFSFTKKRCAFIGFDSNRIKSNDAAAEQEQYEWLEAELKKVQKMRHIFLFCHCPLVHSRLDEDTNYNSFPVELRRKYLDLFKKYGVEILFTGHTHTGRYLDLEGLRSVNIGPVAKAFKNRNSGINIVTVYNDAVECDFERGEDIIDGTYCVPPVAARLQQ